MTHPTDTTTNTGDAPTGPTAVLFTADRFLAAEVDELHPGVTAVPAADDAHLTGLPDSDGILRLTDHTGTRAFYMASDLDDAQVWSRAVEFGAGHVVLLPDGAEWLWERLTAHLGVPTTG